MKILIVEDEAALARAIQSYLKANEILCEIAPTVESALDRIELHDYDCILLDLSLPDGNGFKVLQRLKHLRKSDGVIIISAKDSLDTRIEGLQLGADDYLTKPFHMAELLVRIQALVRRKQFQGQNIVVFNEIAIDLLARTVFVHGAAINFTNRETELLLFLIGNNRKVLSKGAIAEHLSGDLAEMMDSHDFVYAHIKNIKKKLAEAGSAEYVKTIYGLGYKWQGV